MKPLRIGIYSLLAIFIFMWLLNPSYTRFKEFSDSSISVYNEDNYDNGDGPKYTVIRKRVRNYLIYSIYQIGSQDQFGTYTPNKQYVGIFNNFY